MKKKLILLPNLLDEQQAIDILPGSIKDIVNSIDGLIAESEKNARRYLIKFMSHEKANKLPVLLLSEHTKKNELKDIIKSIMSNNTWGVISDCGLTCLADPGADLISLCHENNIEVVSYPGPGSIIAALQLSGFSGQRFAFLGYLPREKDKLVKELNNLEKRAVSEKETQIWIEAPYRFHSMLQSIIDSLNDNTYLCVAADLTLPSQKVVSMKIKDWKKKKFFEDKKIRAVFLISSK